ncbi:NlpC/P60 family protein [Prosthecochloris sp.]|uniref:C40 family peptidase n=1 Tax=Prosthecochloris sp. TaxID=290513 RepID=UPI0025E9C8E3|nr:NlpC/P60 family protein [Prosthecochloris sp.]
MQNKTCRISSSSPQNIKDRRHLIRCLLVCTTLFFCGCTSSYSSQGVKYSGKNTKIYTPLPIRADEDKLVQMLETISTLLGTDYHYGGESVRGFDCSGFVQYIYKDTFEAHLPRTSRQLSKIGAKISPGKLRRGDLVFFKLNSHQIDHVGIYLDRNLFVHASSSRGVTMGNLDERYYKKRFVKAVRLLEIKASFRQ